MAEAQLRILVVANTPAERSGLRSIIDSHPGYRVVADAGDGHTALALASDEKPDVLIVAADDSFPDIMPLGLCHLFTRNHPRTQILVETSHNSRAWIVEGCGKGSAPLSSSKAPNAIYCPPWKPFRTTGPIGKAR